MPDFHSFPQLGNTRSSHQANHVLQTPDTFVRTSLPGMKQCMAVIHTGPAMGAAFMEYTAEFEPEGKLGPAPAQRFLYVLEGKLNLTLEGKTTSLSTCGYAYLPPSMAHEIRATTATRAAVIEKAYQTIDGVASPGPIVSSESSIASEACNGDSDLQVKRLLPDELGFDFAVNTMLYQPGAALSQVEMHIMEHGLLMLEGAGIYRLGDRWYPVAAGDFIWMAPWCPQWFAAVGKVPAKYLIYKDSNRHPLQ